MLFCIEHFLICQSIITGRIISVLATALTTEPNLTLPQTQPFGMRVLQTSATTTSAYCWLLPQQKSRFIRLGFPDAQVSSFGQPVPTAASHFCSWLTRVNLTYQMVCYRWFIENVLDWGKKIFGRQLDEPSVCHHLAQLQPIACWPIVYQRLSKQREIYQTFGKMGKTASEKTLHCCSLPIFQCGNALLVTDTRVASTLTCQLPLFLTNFWLLSYLGHRYQ